ncbi:hypothetical protein [Mesorhizobium sp.]|uniref:hypothetical protein n=1 Tax=Mesorhizobium sp. TaxID=1871066 RepID=UPI0025D9F690|nr:hypothetical protein [Mesorhizobium sp.]
MTALLPTPIIRLGAARRSTFPTRGKGKPHRRPQLPKRQNIDMSSAMEELFGDPAYKSFVLQDRKRLPSRFAARVCGALTSRLSQAD